MKEKTLCYVCTYVVSTLCPWGNKAATCWSVPLVRPLTSRRSRREANSERSCRCLMRSCFFKPARHWSFLCNCKSRYAKCWVIFPCGHPSKILYLTPHPHPLPNNTSYNCSFFFIINYSYTKTYFFFKYKTRIWNLIYVNLNYLSFGPRSIGLYHFYTYVSNYILPFYQIRISL